MSIKLAVAGRRQIVLDAENISLGSDPGCSVTFPDHADVKPKHAIIRSIAGRWLIEVRQAESVFIGTSDPKRMHWLTAGDVIRLTENGPPITFQPTTDGAASPQVKAAPSTQEKRPRAAEPRARMADVILAPDSDEIIPATESAATAKPSSKPKMKPPSSAIIPTLKSSREETPDAAKAPTSRTVRTTKPSSSAIIPVLKTPPTSFEAPQAPLSTTIPATKPPAPKTTRTQPLSSTTIPTRRPPSSTTIKTPGSSDSIPTAKKSQTPLSRTDASSPTAKARRTKTSEFPTFDPSIMTEPDAKVPVLQRLSSWEIPIPPELAEEESEGAFAGRGRKSKKGQEADIKFIKKNVISCAAFALAILILYHGYRELKRALNGPGYGVPQTSMAFRECSDV